jgi:DNA-binding MarR family transcriptional regulator
MPAKTSKAAKVAKPAKAASAQQARLPIGQLLGNLLRVFRSELAERGEGADGVSGIRPAHLQVFGAIKASGTRLTELASSSGLSLSAMAELVDGLEHLGYLERRADPSDGRAKLVCLTEHGWDAIRAGRQMIGAIERDWSGALGQDSFEALCIELQRLLDVLDPAVRQGYAEPPRLGA